MILDYKVPIYVCRKRFSSDTSCQNMQLEYLIIGGCTIQVLYSRTMLRAVLAFWRHWKKKPALSDCYNNKWCSMCISLLFLIFQFHNLPCASFRWWSSIPLVVRYVFRVRRLLNIQIKLIMSQLKLIFFFRICHLSFFFFFKCFSSCLGLVIVFHVIAVNKVFLNLLLRSNY